MKNIVTLVLLLTFVCASAQDDKTIKIIVKTQGSEEVTKLLYHSFEGVIRLRSLEPGKHRFYIKVDEQCMISLYTDKGAKITEEEISEFNKFLSQHKIEYYKDDLMITDCNLFSHKFFPITYTKAK